MTHLVNGLDDVVTEALDALVASSGGRSRAWTATPATKVVAPRRPPRPTGSPWSPGAAPGTSPPTPASSARAC